MTTELRKREALVRAVKAERIRHEKAAARLEREYQEMVADSS